MTHLPQGWEWKSLGEICEVVMGQSPNGNCIFNKDKNKDLIEFHQGKIAFSNKYINKSDFVTSDIRKIAKKNSVVLSVRAPVGEVNITSKDIAIGRGLCSINGIKINNEFLFFYLLTLKKYFNDNSTGSTFKAISTKIIKETKIPLPPLQEQGRIAGILDLAFEKIDKSVELLKANLANLDELAQSVLDRAFNPLGDSIDSTESTQNPSTHDTQSPYPLPQHWEWKSLGEMCKILNGGTPDTKNPVFWDLNQSHEVQTDKSVVGVGGEVERGEGATSQFKPLHPLAKEKSYYWATLVDTKQKYLYSTQRKITQKGLDSSNATLLPVNSVIFSSRASIGEVCIAKVETATNQGYKNFVCDENVLYYEFLYFALQRFAKEIESLAQGTTYKEVSKAKISEFQIPLPKDIKEQEQIAKHLDSTFERIKKLKELYNAQLQDYEELKQSLLTQAFSGKL